MDDLIEALTIFRKYANLRNPTSCSHDTLWIMGVDPSKVSDEDKSRLLELGFMDDSYEEAFISHRFGSA